MGEYELATGLLWDAIKCLWLPILMGIFGLAFVIWANKKADKQMFARMISGEKRRARFNAEAIEEIKEKPAKTYEEIYPYTVNPKFTTPAEHNFFLVLQQAVGESTQVFTKVNLGDLFKTNHKKWRTYRNRISQKHVDFLLCDPKTLKPIMGIELDDSSHNSKQAQKRDTFKDNVFASAELPLLRITVQRNYDIKELRRLIRAEYKRKK